MSHTIRQKKRLASRLARLRGQLDAVGRALERDAECGEVLRLIASARGAMDGLMAEVLEGHIRHHVFPRDSATREGRRAAEDLVHLIRTYLK